MNFVIWGGMDLDPTLWGGLELGLKICPIKTSNFHLKRPGWPSEPICPADPGSDQSDRCLSSNCPFAVETTPKKLEYCSSKTHHKVNSYCSHVAMRFSGIRH